MTTIQPDQLVEQSSGRVWRLLHPDYDAINGARWHIEIVADPVGRYAVGYRSTASDNWLQTQCFDHVSPVVAAPCGDGRQVVAIFEVGFHEMLDSQEFDTNTDMLAWTAEKMMLVYEGSGSGLIGKWYGWDADVHADPADMTVIWDGEQLVWADV
jgi:hypothetical protein